MHAVGAQHQQQHRPTQSLPNRAQKASAAVHIASITAAPPALFSVAASKPALAGGSSSSSNLCQQVGAGGPWALSAVFATTTNLPTQTQRVLICIISSGVDYNNNYLEHNGWSGCSKEHPLDPGGCVLNWQSPMDNKGNWKPRGTYAAAIMAAKPGVDARIHGVIPGRADIYVVPVDTDTGATDPYSTATGGRSRMRAYTDCEGRFRGLQAQDVGPDAPAVRWRMVVYVDVADASPAAPVGSKDYTITESEWLDTATGKTDDHHQPDILLVAPAGDKAGKLGYPAAHAHVVAVGAYGCDGKPLNKYNNMSNPTKPDILAPGKSIPVPDVRKDGLRGVRPWDGSAPAAALTAAAAARLWSAYPNCSADVIRLALLSSRPGSGQPARLNMQVAKAYLDHHKCTAS